jgi:hypothetical protein
MQESAVELEKVRQQRRSQRDETDLALYRRRLDAARKATGGTGNVEKHEPLPPGQDDPEGRPVR